MFQNKDNFQDIIHYFNTLKDIHAPNSLRESIAKKTHTLPRHNGFFFPVSFVQMGIAFAGLVIILLGTSGVLLGGQQVLQKGHPHLGAPSALQISQAPLVNVTIAQLKIKPTFTPTPTATATPTPVQRQRQHSIFEEAIHKVVNNVLHITQFGQNNKGKSSNNESSLRGHDHD